MKKQFLNFLYVILFGFSLILVSCDKETGNPDPTPSTNLTGSITGDVIISENVFLVGEVTVEDGATLTINKGVTIVADASDLSYLLVKQGGKIIAEGTADEPIVFTSTSHEAGAWGGLHICGKASINSGATGLSEIGNAAYGGTTDDDNSGILKYVRVEYSGTILDPTHEANGISFYGVGSGTIVDNVEVYIGADDGIEFFGGTVNISHVKVYGAQDDSFDWTEGWRGKGQYLTAIQTPDGDRGFEGDNLGSNNTATPYANPTFSQVTLIGDGMNGGYGMKLREGTKGEIYNFIVTGFDKRSIHVEHDQTLLNVVDGSLMVDYGYVNDVVSDVAIKYSASEDVDQDGNVIGVHDKPANLADHYFENSSNIHLMDLTHDVNGATTYTGGKDASTIDPWFASDDKIGAGSDWSSWMKSGDDVDASTLNTTKLLSGIISEDTYVFEDAELIGNVRVKDGATLYVKPGVTITADPSDLSYLLIEQGGKIEAIGNANQPVVFTSSLHEAGAWGGLHICGKASINSGATGLSEIGGATYGGTDDADNSGTLKYVRVEYSGTILDPEHEANGISFYGVGSGTVVDHVEIYVGADDGIECFGGTVSFKHVYVYGAQDDSFDWTEGWRGKGQYLIAVQTPDGDRGFEGDNLGSNNTAEPYANPTFSQVTLIGDNTNGGYGMKLREGTKGKIYNFIVTNFDKRSIHVEHDQTLLNVVDGSLMVDYGYVNSNVSDVAIKYSASEDVDENGNVIGVHDKPANLADHYFENSANIHLMDLTSGVDMSTTYTGGMDLSSTDSWFTSDDKIGAGSDWTTGWIKE
ncbi:hypothetical protein ACE01N_07690 [Saccharicrinis sp. FJH2]|uniref:hypothetical protein n=1 Tax=Saccharicrinis sp. FJH65 TaxID=3344659 RepID=UPI0035F3475F